MKRILSILFVLLLFVQFKACSAQPAQAEEPPTIQQYLPMVNYKRVVYLHITAEDSRHRPLPNTVVYAVDFYITPEGDWVFGAWLDLINGCETDAAGQCTIIVDDSPVFDRRDGWLFFSSPNLELGLDVQMAANVLYDDMTNEHTIRVQFLDMILTKPMQVVDGQLTGSVR